MYSFQKNLVHSCYLTYEEPEKEFEGIRKEERGGKRILNKDRKNVPDKNWLISHSP